MKFKKILLIMVFLITLSGCSKVQFGYNVTQLEKNNYKCNPMPNDLITSATELGFEEPDFLCTFSEDYNSDVSVDFSYENEEGTIQLNNIIFFKDNNFIGQITEFDQVNENYDFRTFYDLGFYNNTSENYEELCVVETFVSDGLLEKDCTSWINGDVLYNKTIAGDQFLNNYNLLGELYQDIDITKNIQ